MAESLFEIFGDHLTRQTVKNGPRQPLSNNENMGKTVTMGPIKPNEPMKKGGEPKKSFLQNTGKALQSTPARQVFTPRAMNVGSLIYTDEKDKGFSKEKIEFTKPTIRHYDYHCELLDYLPKVAEHVSPPSTPSPLTRRHSMELDCSYHDKFFTDDFSNDSLPDEDLGLPDIY